MKKHRYLILSGIWIVCAMVNYWTETSMRTVLFNVFAAAIFLSLAVLKAVFDSRGKKGQEAFNRIGIGYVVALSIFLTVFIGTTIFSKPDGYTIQSREQLLKDLPRGFDWEIAVEKEVNSHIVSGIYSRDNKSGIAVFTPFGEKKYKLLARQWRDSNDIIISQFVIDNVWYDVIWFNGAKTDYAQITYNINGEKQESIIHNPKNMEIFVNPAPAKDYSLNVVYYDDAGNKYE